MSSPFRIGIDPGWGDQFESTLAPFVRRHFGSARDFRWEVMEPFPSGTVPGEVADRYDGLVILGTRFDSSSFSPAKRLICIARWGVGFDAIDMASATAADVMVALTPNAVKRAVAEAQIALIFALAKRIPDLDRRTRAGQWRTNLPLLGIDVVGKTLASVGLGRIASELFRMARGIGFGRLLACDPYCSPERARELGVELTDMDTVMSEGDFVTVNAFLNDSTRGLIGDREFALMKPSAYFVNTARGPIVQESALIETLRAGRIAGAGIDVFEQEPPAPDNPLLAMDNVIVAPHSMAWTQEAMAGNSDDACRNLLAVASGRVPPCLADPTAAQRPGVQAKLAPWRSR